jgi:hypothetical protein
MYCFLFLLFLMSYSFCSMEERNKSCCNSKKSTPIEFSYPKDGWERMEPTQRTPEIVGALFKISSNNTFLLRGNEFLYDITEPNADIISYDRNSRYTVVLWQSKENFAKYLAYYCKQLGTQWSIDLPQCNGNKVSTDPEYTSIVWSNDKEDSSNKFCIIVPKMEQKEISSFTIEDKNLPLDQHNLGDPHLHPQYMLRHVATDSLFVLNENVIFQLKEEQIKKEIVLRAKVTHMIINNAQKDQNRSLYECAIFNPGKDGAALSLIKNVKPAFWDVPGNAYLFFGPDGLLTMENNGISTILGSQEKQVEENDSQLTKASKEKLSDWLTGKVIRYGYYCIKLGGSCILVPSIFINLSLVPGLSFMHRGLIAMAMGFLAMKGSLSLIIISNMISYFLTLSVCMAWTYLFLMRKRQ